MSLNCCISYIFDTFITHSYIMTVEIIQMYTSHRQVAIFYYFLCRFFKRMISIIFI